MSFILAIALVFYGSRPQFGLPELQGELFWTFPVNCVGLQLVALSAFFLAFFLPMTLLGTIYAIGYLVLSRKN